MAAQREAAMVLVGVVVGAAVLGLLMMFSNRIGRFAADTESYIILSLDGSDCVVSGRQLQTRVGKNKKIEWIVLNFCNGPQTVRVANFFDPASPPPSKPTDCDTAVHPGAIAPFKEASPWEISVDAPSDHYKPNQNTLRLQVKPRGGSEGLPDRELLYEFDICVAGKPFHPSLLVER